jgi:hypothetical protein
LRENIYIYFFSSMQDHSRNNGPYTHRRGQSLSRQSKVVDVIRRQTFRIVNTLVTILYLDARRSWTTKYTIKLMMVRMLWALLTVLLASFFAFLHADGWFLPCDNPWLFFSHQFHFIIFFVIWNCKTQHFYSFIK